MRVAIFVGAMMIGMSINPELVISDLVIKFYAYCLFSFIIADVIDVCKSKS